MKKLLAMLLAGTTVGAFADSGTYLGTGLGMGWNNVAAPAATFRADMGYDFTDVFGIEVGTTGLTQSGSAPNQSLQAYDFSVKGMIPLGDTTSIYGQLGAAYLSPGILAGNLNGSVASSADQWEQAGWNTLLGVGVNFNMSKSIGLNISDLYYFGGSQMQGNTDALLVGLNYHF